MKHSIPNLKQQCRGSCGDDGFFVIFLVLCLAAVTFYLGWCSGKIDKPTNPPNETPKIVESVPEYTLLKQGMIDGMRLYLVEDAITKRQYQIVIYNGISVVEIKNDTHPEKP